MKAYSMDLRQRIFTDCDAGMGTRAVATKYRVSESWVRRLKQRRREQGEIAPRRRQMPPPKWAAHSERLRGLVQTQPDATLKELKQRLGVEVSVQTLSRALRLLHLTFKKRFFGRRNRIAPTFKSAVGAGVSRC